MSDTTTKTARRERPILFSDALVRAILDGRKTVTRRMIGLDTLTGSETRGYDWTWRGQAPVRSIAQQRRHPCGCWQDMRDADFRALCPYGVPGDLLYVREAWRTWERPEDGFDGIRFRADDAFRVIDNTAKASDLWLEAHNNGKHSNRWRPSIHLPRWAARLWLEVVSVRAERLQEITEEDARAEGVTEIGTTDRGGWCSGFADLWDAINGKRPGAAWNDNPWVWRVEFRRAAR